MENVYLTILWIDVRSFFTGMQGQRFEDFREGVFIRFSGICQNSFKNTGIVSMAETHELAELGQVILSEMPGENFESTWVAGPWKKIQGNQVSEFFKMNLKLKPQNGPQGMTDDDGKRSESFQTLDQVFKQVFKSIGGKPWTISMSGKVGAEKSEFFKQVGGQATLPDEPLASQPMKTKYLNRSFSQTFHGPVLTSRA